MTVKERLHTATETMSDEEPQAALRTLAESSGDPVAWMLDHAPLDDEPETEGERRAVAEAHADRERGIQPVPIESGIAEVDRARKDLRRIDPPTRERILRAIARLAQGAELTGDVKRLQGSHEYRLRVGDWRVRFERNDQQLTVTVVRVLPRGRAYDR